MKQYPLMLNEDNEISAYDQSLFCLHTGLSTDSKPSEPNGHLFLEKDTGKFFLRSGGAWVDVTTATLTAFANTVIAARLPLYGVKSEDQGTTSTSLVDISELGLLVAANASYFFRWDIVYKSSLAAANIKLGLTGPSAPNVFSYAISIPSNAGGGGIDFTTGFDTALDGVSLVTADNNYVASISGILVNGANAGTLQPQFGVTNGAATCTVKTGSWGMRHKLSA